MGSKSPEDEAVLEAVTCDKFGAVYFFGRFEALYRRYENQFWNKGNSLDIQHARYEK